MPWWGWLLTVAGALLIIWWVVAAVFVGSMMSKVNKRIDDGFDNDFDDNDLWRN